MSYDRLMLASAALFSVLATCLLFAPALIFWLFGVQDEPTAIVMSNRAAILFVGLTTLAWRARGVQGAEARHLVLTTLAVTMLGLILVGTYHAVTGQVGPGIALALLGEAAFLALYLWCLRRLKAG